MKLKAKNCHQSDDGKSHELQEGFNVNSSPEINVIKLFRWKAYKHWKMAEADKDH